MAYLAGFGAALPGRVVPNREVADLVGCEADWIRDVSGIEERRWASDEETVVSLGVAAARDCLKNAGVEASALGCIFVSSGTSPRRFPGPAATIAKELGLDSTPAIDLPVASAGGLFGMALASRLPGYTLVVAAEKMSEAVLKPAPDKNTSILFGDGAGACLVSQHAGPLRIIDSLLCTDGSFADDLQLPLDGSLLMNGRSVILQATRKLPRVILDVLARNGVAAQDVAEFIVHQANLNLLQRVATGVGVPIERFYSNIARYGNTSSASVLIAAREWFAQARLQPGQRVCFAVFGAGFHWGSLLAEAA
ncbi:MAG: ketoacyl-ACP synthase III [Bryobacterales bacterium]|nr:ketoacyl-ACP synthase III [Bryobacterales bacterium]